MNVKEAIKKRRSVRAYKNKPVADRLIKEVVDAARLAPSGHNMQPWRFYVLKNNKSLCTRLRKEKIFYQDFPCTAPAIIVCCADPEVYHGWREKGNKKRAFRDLNIASAFLVLRATELGLGTCYVGWIDGNRLKKMLKLPKNHILPYVITIGYPAQKLGKHKRKDLNKILRFI